MIDIAIDDDNDLVWTAGDLVLVTGADVTKQLLRVRSLIIRGEWFADSRVGMPILDDMLGERADLLLVKSWYRFMILSTPGVASINELDLTLNDATRELDVTGEVVYTDGQTGPFRETLFISRGA
jgi:hypothetical protein